MPDKYDTIKALASNKDEKGIPNDGSWIIGTVISLIAVVVPPFLAFSFDWWKAVVCLLKSADIVMFFVSTVAALLVSCSWEKEQKQIHLWLMVYIFLATVLYTWISYNEYAKKEMNVSLVCFLNVVMFSVIVYIIAKAYRGCKAIK